MLWKAMERSRRTNERQLLGAFSFLTDIIAFSVSVECNSLFSL